MASSRTGNVKSGADHLRWRRWTESEVAALLDGIRKHGQGKWCAIVGDAEIGLGHRTTLQVKEKYKALKKMAALTTRAATLPPPPPPAREAAPRADARPASLAGARVLEMAYDGGREGPLRPRKLRCRLRLPGEGHEEGWVGVKRMLPELRSLLAPYMRRLDEQRTYVAAALDYIASLDYLTSLPAGSGPPEEAPLRAAQSKRRLAAGGEVRPTKASRLIDDVHGGRVPDRSGERAFDESAKGGADGSANGGADADGEALWYATQAPLADGGEGRPWSGEERSKSGKGQSEDREARLNRYPLHSEDNGARSHRHHLQSEDEEARLNRYDLQPEERTVAPSSITGVPSAVLESIMAAEARRLRAVDELKALRKRAPHAPAERAAASESRGQPAENGASAPAVAERGAPVRGVQSANCMLM